MHEARVERHHRRAAIQHYEQRILLHRTMLDKLEVKMDELREKELREARGQEQERKWA